MLNAIGTTLRLCDVFQQVSDQRWAQTVNHELVGVVSYYGKHYTTFFFHTKLRVWVYFDDANVKEVGPSWEGVVDKCARGRYQPLLLLYALPQPQTQSQLPQPQPSPQELAALAQAHRRAVTPSPEKASMGSNVRRAITPTPNRALPICDYQNLAVIQSKIFPPPSQPQPQPQAPPPVPLSTVGGTTVGGSSSSSNSTTTTTSTIAQHKELMAAIGAR